MSPRRRRRTRCPSCGASTVEGVCALCGDTPLPEPEPESLRELFGASGLSVDVDHEPDPRRQ